MTARWIVPLLLAAAASAQPPFPVVINAADRGLAMPPSFAAGPGGALLFAWSSYHLDRERLLTVALESRGLSRIMELSPGPGTCYQPVILSTGPRSGWVFWMRQSLGRWQIAGRERADGQWRPLVVLAGESGNALMPAAVASGDSVTLAWEDHSASPQRMAARHWDGRSWSAPQPVSSPTEPAFRPVLAAGDAGQVWALWDSYSPRLRAYSVRARRLLPASGPEETVSPAGQSCLKAAALHTRGQGLTAAWVATRDVIGAAGIVDHWDTLQMAVRGATAWEPVKDAGRLDVAGLQHGLLTMLEPEFRSVSGYSGLARHPMLAVFDGSPWLLWERKIVPGGGAWVPGELCARRLQGRALQPPVVLHQGLVEYQVPSDPRADARTLAAVGRNPQHGLVAVSLDPRHVLDFAEFQWTGWKPVDLPLHPRGDPASIKTGGRRFNLYWGDFHVHSALSPDAEGEFDELIHYSRDKSNLDVVVIQENDSNSWLKTAYIDHRLSASEYALSVYLSRKHTEIGRFLALPGWEWSHRTDDDKPNHRTVLFPGADTPILRHTENGGDFVQLCDAVEAAGGLMIAQHEDFRLTHRPCDANLEVATGWSIYIDPPQKIHADLSAGFRVGFVATSDGHRRVSGYGGGVTGIYATELTPASIVEALREHRVFATTGARVVLDARANGKLMGEDLRAAGDVSLTLRAAAPRPIRRAVLVSDGREIFTAPGNGRTQLDCAHTDRPSAGFHWYYWRVELEGAVPAYRGNSEVAEGHLAWSSPHRVTVGPH